MTYTEQALQIVTRQLKVAARDNTDAHSRGIRFTPRGYIYIGNDRIGHDAAVQKLAHMLEVEAGEPARIITAINHLKLNINTQNFFYWLCEQIQEQTKDHDMIVPARIGKLDIPLTLAQCPLLTNLKRAGLIESVPGAKKSHKLVRLTDAGRAYWQTKTEVVVG